MDLRVAERENNNFGFGTDDQLYGIGYPVIKHSVFPVPDHHHNGASHPIPCAKLVGETIEQNLSPHIDYQHSAMSFGSLGDAISSATMEHSGRLLPQHR